MLVELSSFECASNLVEIWLCPLLSISQIDLLGECERVIHLDAEVAHSALQLAVAEEQLAGVALLVGDG